MADGGFPEVGVEFPGAALENRTIPLRSAREAKIMMFRVKIIDW